MSPGNAASKTALAGLFLFLDTLQLIAGGVRWPTTRLGLRSGVRKKSRNHRGAGPLDKQRISDGDCGSARHHNQSLSVFLAAFAVEEVRCNRGEKALKRAPAQASAQLDRIRTDPYVGMGFSNVVAFFIILTAGSPAPLRNKSCVLRALSLRWHRFPNSMLLRIKRRSQDCCRAYSSHGERCVFSCCLSGSSDTCHRL
jgi:hypothetical protein